MTIYGNTGDILREVAGMPSARARMVLRAIFGKAESGNRKAESEELHEAAAAFERDMRPVREAIVSALEAGDMAALRGLRAMLSDLLSEVNREPALADLLAHQLGKSFLDGLRGSRGGAGGAEEEALATGNGGNPWHSHADGRFTGPGGGSRKDQAEAEIKANIQRGRNAMRRVLSEETDVIAAMHRTEIGDIDFVWEHKEHGIKHLIERREHQDEVRPDLNKLSPTELLDRVPEVIARGKISPAGSKLEIDHEGIRVILARRGGKSANAWMMSGYEIDPNSQRKGGNR